MKRALKNLLFACAHYLGVNAVFRVMNKNKVRVLMYHGVTMAQLDPPYWTQLDYESFKWQMNYIKKHFNTTAASQLTADGPVNNAVVITFDDGLRNVYDNALPILKDLNLEAVCFVLPELSLVGKSIWPDRIYETFMQPGLELLDLTGFSLARYELKNKPVLTRSRLARELISVLKSQPHGIRNQVIEYLEKNYGQSGSPQNMEFRLMTMEQIRSLSESGVFKIGLHTDTHPILSTQTGDEQAVEIAGCKKKLKEAGIKYIDIFAYPNGRFEDFNDTSVNILKENGIFAALTTEDGFYIPGDDVYSIRRIPIGCDMGRHEFTARLSGLYYFIKAFSGH